MRRRVIRPGTVKEDLQVLNRGKYGVRVWVGVDHLILVEVVPFPPFVVVLGWLPAVWTTDATWPSLWADYQRGCPMKRREKKRVELEGRAAHDQEFQASYPTLFDYLTATTYDGDAGSPRTVSTLLVFAADGVFKACLRERDDGVCCWVSGRSFGDVLHVLEQELAADTAVWRADRIVGAPVASRKPKPKSP